MKTLIMFALLALASVSARLSEFTTATTSFTFDYFKRAYVPTENVVMSPISIQSSLAMVYPLAGRKVSPVMQQHLYLPIDKNRATSNLRDFVWMLNKQKPSLKVLSKVYHINEELNPQVQPLLRDTFGAELEVADFRDATSVADAVNSWVNRTTNGMIKKFMNPYEVNSNTDLMLLNVVALNASWEIPFDAGATQSKTFHFVNGDHQVEMMFHEGEYSYAYLSDYRCRAVKMPYEEGTDLSMILVLPLAGSSLQDLIPNMDVAFYEKLNEQLDDELWPVRVKLQIPKFTIRKSTDATSLLKKMGMKPLFEEADFDLFMEHKSFIGTIKQSAAISIDEKHTEAAAVTSIQFDRISGPALFYADHPFIYMIQKRSTKDIIFIGHYSVYEQPQ